MKREDLITAYLDGELGETEQLDVEKAMDADPRLRRLHEELLATRRGLKTLFEEERGVPRAPVIPGVRTGRWRGLAVLGSAAAVVLAISAIFVLGDRRAEASADVVLERAARSYAASGETELWLRFELPSSPQLDRMIASMSGRGQGLFVARAMKVRIAEDSRFVAMPTPDPSGSWSARDGLVGFDGRQFWRYAHKDGEAVLHVRDVADLDPERRRKLDEMELVRLLSWDFVRELGSEGVEVEEVTWPADRRGGRRVFEVRPALEDGKGRDAGKTPLRWRRAKVTVDPKRDRIERVEAELVIFGLAVLRVTADVAETDGAGDAALFRADRHVPAGTRVVEVPRTASGR